MTGAELLAAYAKGQRDFHGEDLQNAQLDKANLNDINLEGANLAGANLQWTTLRHANLRGANLDGANLSNTDLYQVQMQGANVTNATNLAGATARLVDYNKRYNEVTWAMAHDSHTAVKYYGDYEDMGHGGAVDQGQPVSGQLAGGIRVFRISSLLWGDISIGPGTIDPNIPRDVYLNHGGTHVSNVLGEIPFYLFGSLTDYLTHVRDFLIANPTEIVTIIDESDNIHTHVAQIYDDVITKKGHLSIFKAALPGTSDAENWPTLDQLKAGQWPTLNQMLERNQRLVVFMGDDPQPNDPAWMLPAYQGMIATSDSASPLAWPEQRPQFPGINDDGQPIYIDSSRKTGCLYLLNHYFYHSVTQAPSGAINESARDLNKWCVGDLIIENTLRAYRGTNGRWPNFLNVDFYQGMQLAGNVNYLMALVEAINNRDYSEDDDVARKMQGARIAETHGLQIGATYNISLNVLSGALSESLAYQTDGSVKLSPTNLQDSSQVWQLVYNRPGPGIAFVNPASGTRLYSDSNANDDSFSYLKTQPDGMQAGAPTGDENSGFEIRYDATKKQWCICRIPPAPDSIGTLLPTYEEYKHRCINPRSVLSAGLTTGSPVVFSAGLTGGSPVVFNNHDLYLWQFTPLTTLPEKAFSVTGTPGVIQRADGQLTVVAALGQMTSPQQQDFSSFVEITCSDWPDPQATTVVAQDSGSFIYGGVSLVESDYGNLEMVTINQQSQLTHFYKDSSGWHPTTTFGGFGSNPNAANPIMIQSHFDFIQGHQNLEVVVPRPDGGFAHYYRDSSLKWQGGDVVIGAGQGFLPVSGIAFLQRAKGRKAGDFEVIACSLDGRLLHHSRPVANLNDAEWVFRGTIATNIPVASWATPGLVERADGTLHLVVALTPTGYSEISGIAHDYYTYEGGGGLAHYVYNDDQNQWSQVGDNPILPTEGRFDAVSLFENPRTGNLEIVARRGNELLRYYRNDTNGKWFKKPDLGGRLI
ncbi:MAG TPA: pentapeptide repeat-containing protein [Blastocatellia bacterium]|nr:pentapeptide repeat-containing protein [Blastocatellia bacterium]